MEPSAVGDDLNEISVVVNVAHRLLLGIRDEIAADPGFQSILDDLDAAHERLDEALDSIGRAVERVDEQADRPREQRPAIH